VEVTRRQALALRMASLLLRERPGGRLADVAGVVTWLGAMQAQDLASGLWSFGVRLPRFTVDEVTAALLDLRFAIDGDAWGLLLSRERDVAVAARTLLGKPTACVGRDRELAHLVAAKVRPLSAETGVRFVAQSSGESVLPNRAANLVALILLNLAQNALQATRKGDAVTLSLTEGGEQIVCEVRDEGPGLLPELTTQLFAPCRSSKEGGSGIGLAISKQLANHLGAALELKRQSAAGCVFALTVPFNASSAGLEKSSRASSPLIC